MRRGGSRQTKNVGLIVGLEEVDGGGSGLVVATTHLSVYLSKPFGPNLADIRVTIRFWHPK